MMCRDDDREDIPIGRWFLWLMAGVCALCAASLFAGCMTLEIHDSLIISSEIGQSKPIEAGISTTPEAIGMALKAAGYGNPVNLQDIQAIIKEYRKIRETLKPHSRLHPLDWRKLRTRATA